jgi:hypothetical protein
LLAAFLLLMERTALAAQRQPEVLDGQIQAVGRAADWLVVTHQNEDGGYAAFSSGAGAAPSDVAGTVDAVLALASTGYNVAAPYPGRSATPVQFLEENAADVAAYAAQGGGQSGKLILALTAAAQNPREFGGYNFVVSHTEHLSPTGAYNVSTPFDQSLAVLAHAAVSDTVPVSATQWLLERQSSDGDLSGSWDDGFGTVGNIDGTAMAVMALVAAREPVTGTALSEAREFLARTQLESGGWGYTAEGPESANSTALAVQALSALGEDFYSSDSTWAREGISPLQALLSWQSDSGAFQADFGEGPADDFFTTVQALPAATGRSYPLPGRYEAARAAVACLADLRDVQSGGWEEFAGGGANAGGTSRAIQALVAQEQDLGAERWVVNDVSPLEALTALTPAYLEEGRGGRVGIVMQGVAAAGGDVTNVAGSDLTISMTEYLSPTGEYDHTGFGPFSHAEAILGLSRAGQEVDPAAVEWLVSAGEGGVWGDPDATGISLQALSSVGALPDELATEALASLQATQQADGGWGFQLPSSVNSTAEVAQGLVAVDQNPFDPTWSQVVSGTLQGPAGLAIAQQAENGCWPNLFGPGDDPFATTDGIILLALEPPWGTVVEGEEPGEETAVPEATATDEAEVVVEATAESQEEPTATVEVPEPTEEPAELEVVATPESDAATEDPVAEEADEVESRATFPWALAVVGAVVLAIVIIWLLRARG